MPSYGESNPQDWNESDSFRETMLQFFEELADKAAVRHVGRVLYDLAVEASRDLGGESSVTRAELRAVAADLRYTGGYLFHVIGRSAESCSLDAADEKLARFAGKLAGQVGALVEKIERRLS
jgi:hypothetical protein